MKLEPKAKPIRIRIKLGNSEYSSWDSVKKSNFSIKELYPLFKDGRLERWLEQIGEEEDAHRTGELSKQCGNGDMKDYIQFLSLFFDEVAESLSAFKGEEWSLYDYLSSARLDTVEIIYAKTMELEEIDWGEELAKVVTDKEKYKELFTYLESFSKNNPQPERCRRIISTFYSNCSQKGYQFVSAFKGMSLDYIVDLYQNECFQMLDIDWGKLFADCIKDWNTDYEKVKKIIKCNHRSSFYMCCYGIPEAMNKLGSWFLLANTDEYGIIINALDEWNENRSHYNRDKYNYKKINSPLGKQILDFMQSLIDLKKHNFWDYSHKLNNVINDIVKSPLKNLDIDSSINISPNFYRFRYGMPYDDYLNNVKQVMILVHTKRRKKYGSKYFWEEPKLDEMRNNGDELAAYVIGHPMETYWDIAQHAADLFRGKLTKERM